MELFSNLLKNVLKGIYENLWASVSMAILFMFAYIPLKKIGIKRTAVLWIRKFQRNREFRITAFFAFYVFMILFRTILGRAYWGSSVGNVLGTWGLYDSKGELYTDGIENVILFIPLSALYFARQGQIGKYTSEFGVIKTIFRAGYMSFVFSIIIEFCQLIFKLGSFQLSDIAFNTAGGVIGGILYLLIYQLRKDKYQ